MPRGTYYTLETTEPTSLSDWLSYLGMALAAVAIVAGVIASGGAAAPVAGTIAVWAGIGAGAAGIGSTLADLREKSKQGMLTDRDVDRAMIQIGIDLVGMMSLGLGRLVSTGVRTGLAASRFFFLLEGAARATKFAAVAGDIVQVVTATADFIDAYRAIQNQPGLTDDQRREAMGRLVRSALLTGALLTIALKGDIADIRPNRTLHVTGVDNEGHYTVQSEPSAPDVHPPVEGAHGPTPHSAPHAEVHAPVQTHAAEAGGGLTVAGTSHAVGVGGRGPTRSLYFCSDLCSELADKLDAVLACMPPNYPGRDIFLSLRRRARTAGNRLARGQISDAEANTLATDFAGEIGRHSAHDPVFAKLVEMSPAELIANSEQFKAQIARELDISGGLIETLGEQMTLGRSQVRDPTGATPTRSGLENDVLDVFGFGPRERPGGALPPEHFDVGNFGHTHAEALVPGLPKGLAAEVTITLPDGTVRRADRVRFFRDSEGNITGGIVYEIKPNTPQWRRAGEIQAELYARYLEEAHGLPRGRFGHTCLTYNASAVRRLVRQLRAPPP